MAEPPGKEPPLPQPWPNSLSSILCAFVAASAFYSPWLLSYVQLKHLTSWLGRIFFFFFWSSKIYEFVDVETGFSGAAPIHLIDFRILHSPEPRRTCRFRLIARVGFITQPWGLLNDPSVIITHLKPFVLVPVLSTIKSRPKINIRFQALIRKSACFQ